MKKLFLLASSLLLMNVAYSHVFSVVLPDSLSKKPLDGRLLLILSNNGQPELRFQVTAGPETQLIFGVDVENWQPGTAKTINASSDGYTQKEFDECYRRKLFGTGCIAHL